MIFSRSSVDHNVGLRLTLCNSQREHVYRLANNTQNRVFIHMRAHTMSHANGLTSSSPSGACVHICITIIPTGSITNFTLSIRPARNYPLDLYILTDLSYSFNNDLSTLKTLGTNIGNNYTSSHHACTNCMSRDYFTMCVRVYFFR